MSAALGVSRPSSHRRWWGLVGLVLVVQLGLIFWLGERTSRHPRAAVTGLTISLAGRGSAELLALRDPTLFVLPRSPRMVRSAALSAPPMQAGAIAWPEPTNYPPPALDSPSAAFTRFVASNTSQPFLAPVAPLPQPTLPTLTPQAVTPGHSTARVEGPLAQRRLLTALNLPAQTNQEILRESVVRLMVGADGAPRTVTLLSSSGSAEADRLALDQARGARFEALSAGPAPDPRAGLTLGQMVFHWHTVPAAASNAPASANR